MTNPQPVATPSPIVSDAMPVPMDASPDAAEISRLDAGVSTAIDAALSDSLSATKPKAHSVAQLAGNWSGSAVVPQYGVAIASVRLNKKGKGTFRVQIAGFTKTGTVRVLSWNGKSIRARAKGIERQIPAKLKGNKLRLTLPVVGKVTVYR